MSGSTSEITLLEWARKKKEEKGWPWKHPVIAAQNRGRGQSNCCDMELEASLSLPGQKVCNMMHALAQVKHSAKDAIVLREGQTSKRLLGTLMQLPFSLALQRHWMIS